MLTSLTGACCSKGRHEGAFSLMTPKPPLAPRSLPCPPTRAAVRRSAARGRLAVPARVPAQIVEAVNNNQLICLGARLI